MKNNYFYIFILMLALFQALMSFVPYGYEMRETRYFNMLKDYDLLRKFMKNTCNFNCDLNNEQEFLENCPALKNLDPDVFPEYGVVGYKFYSAYDTIACRLWSGYNETSHGVYISDSYFKDIVISVSTRMIVNYEQLMLQYCTFEDHFRNENDGYICHNDEIHDLYMNEFMNNKDLIEKVDKIIEHTCDFNCSATLDYSVVVNNEPMHTVADSCRIKNIEIEKGKFYDMYIQYDQGMCDVFNTLKKYNFETTVDSQPTSSDNPDNSELSLILMIVLIVAIVIIIIICITICCVKNSMWYARKELEENVSP